MKRVFIVHGWGFNPKMNWYPWIKEELEKKGFVVEIPLMPETENPVINTWVNYLHKVVGKADEETYFVGHSIGCQTILRYLQTLNKTTRIGGCVFVAGWFKLINLEDSVTEDIAKPWLEASIDFERIKRACKKFVEILSENDPYNCLEENKSIFERKLNAKVIVKKNKGHFTKEDGINEVPIVLEEILEISKKM